MLRDEPNEDQEAESTRSSRPRGTDTDTWQDLPSRIERHGHYLDAFLGTIKRDAYLSLIDRWADCRGQRVLKTDLFEEGLGPDAFFGGIAPVTAVAVGIDLSVAVARRARRRFASEGVLCVAADVRSLPFRSATFDRVVSPSTLDHFPDHGDLHVSLVELRRVSRPDARVVVTLDNRSNVSDPLLRLVARLKLVPYYLGRSYTVEELRSELERAGYSVLDTTGIVHTPRLVAAGSVAVAKRVGWGPLTRAVQAGLLRMQRWNGTRLGRHTACFVAALATPGSRPSAGDPPSGP